MDEQLLAILLHYGIDPNAVTENGQTALQRLKSAVDGCLDEIEEELENRDDL